MPGPSPVPVIIPSGIRSKIKRMVRGQRVEHRLVVRARIVELAAAGWNNADIAKRVGTSARVVRSNRSS